MGGDYLGPNLDRGSNPIRFNPIIFQRRVNFLGKIHAQSLAFPPPPIWEPVYRWGYS
jgi:hypothetical protein